MGHRKVVFHGSWKHGLLWILERKSGLSRILEEWSSFMDTGRADFHGRAHHILHSSCLNKMHQAPESSHAQAATLINSSTWRTQLPAVGSFQDKNSITEYIECCSICKNTATSCGNLSRQKNSITEYVKRMLQHMQEHSYQLQAAFKTKKIK